MATRKMATPACAACKVGRKKCSEECMLAPYFPSSDPTKFEVVQRIFGKSHLIKMLKGVPIEQRADVVNSVVLEATARDKDPVHGLASVIDQMKNQIVDLESQLAAAQVELEMMRLEQGKLLSLFAAGSHDENPNIFCATDSTSQQNEDPMLEDEDPLLLWEPLWDLQV